MLVGSGQNGKWPGLGIFAFPSGDVAPPGYESAPKFLMLLRRNTVNPYPCPLGRPTVRKAVEGAGRGGRKKRRPSCNGTDTG